MKTELKTIAAAEQTAADASAKLVKIAAERERYTAAHTAAQQQAQAKRAEAHRLIALAAVGEGKAADGEAALQEADRLAKQAELFAGTVAALDDAHAAEEARREDARAAQAQATREALAVHAGQVGSEYRAAALAYIAAIRRARAVEALAKRAGAQVSIVRGASRGFEIPACVEQRDDDPPRTGFVNDAWYSDRTDSMYNTDVLDAERERLAALGLRV